MYLPSIPGFAVATEIPQLLLAVLVSILLALLTIVFGRIFAFLDS